MCIYFICVSREIKKDREREEERKREKEEEYEEREEEQKNERKKKDTVPCLQEMHCPSGKADMNRQAQ